MKNQEKNLGIKLTRDNLKNGLGNLKNGLGGAIPNCKRLDPTGYLCRKIKDR